MMIMPHVPVVLRGRSSRLLDLQPLPSLHARRGDFSLSPSPGAQGESHPLRSLLSAFRMECFRSRVASSLIFQSTAILQALSNQSLEVRFHSVIKKRTGCLLPKSKREKLRRELRRSFSNKGHGLACTDPTWDLQPETTSALTRKRTGLQH